MKVGIEPSLDNSAGSSRSRKSGKRYSIGSASLHDTENENLDDNFEKTPWIPPSIQKAKEYKKQAIYRYADGVSMGSIDVIHAADLGSGVTLYFAFARMMAFALIIMSLLACSALIMVYSGSGILAQDRDALGLYRYTLGNIGENPASAAYVNQTQCFDARYPANTTCIHFLNGQELSLSDAGAILTTMEFLQIMVFFLSIWGFKRHAEALENDKAKRNTSMADYAIKVTHLPPNTTAAEIVAHFSNLYQLEVKDFRKRPALENARCVQSCNHNGDHSLVGTWIAEVVVHKSIGKFISSFRDKQHVTERLYRCRAKMKMYSKTSCHDGGHDEALYLIAQKEMHKQEVKINSLTAMNVRRKGLKLNKSSKDDLEELEHAAYIHEDIYTSIDAPTVAAFITFEYSESLARCVHDYSKYHTFPLSLFYPKKLKFKGRKIKVVRAPEPDQIIWENLEVTKAQQFYLRTRTALITISLVVLCFIVILQASIFKQRFSDKIPSSSLCKQTVPELYTTSTVLSAKSVSSYSLMRSDNATLAKQLDAQCNDVVSHTFYAIYSQSDFEHPVVPYSISTCFNTTSDHKDLCPTVTQPTYCPCVSISDTSQCESAECETGSQKAGCVKFDAGTIGSCYCYEQLSDILNGGGVIAALNKVTSSTAADPCYNFYSNYSLSSGITYASIAFAAMVNIILKFFIKKLVSHEAHTSLDKEQGSRMSKVFMSNYFTMTVIVLVAYGKLDNLPAIMHLAHIFQGDFRDFNQGWYGNVGFYFVTTFILQSFAPLMLGLLKFLVLKPLLRCYHHGKVRKFQSHSIVMQKDLNLLQVGDVFDATTHTAQLLSLLFFAMTFAPGLPLLMPLCCFSFVMYFYVDKMLLCRFSQKPSQIGDASIKIVVSFLPYAAVLRFAIAVWMFSCTSIFPLDSTTHSTNSVHQSYLQYLNDARDSSFLPANLDFFRLRILTRNCFPLFLGFVVVVLVLFLRRIWTFLPLYWVFKCFNCMIGCFQTEKKSNVYKQFNRKSGTIHPWHLLQLNDPLRQEMAPFTGEYFKYVRILEYTPDTCCQALMKSRELSQAEIDHGWGLHELGDFIVRKKQTKSGRMEKTYEVIADSGCHSYNIEMVPSYVLAMKGLREGTRGDGFSRNRPSSAGSGSAASRKTGINMDPDYLAELRAKHQQQQRGVDTGDEYFTDGDSIDRNMLLPTDDPDDEAPVAAKYNFDMFDEPPEEDEMIAMMRQNYTTRQSNTGGSGGDGGGVVRLEPMNIEQQKPPTGNKKKPQAKGNRR